MNLFKKSDDNQQDLILQELRGKVSQAGMPEDVERLALQELDTLARINSSAAEFSIGVTYVDYLATMPWKKKTADNLDLVRAQRILDEEHYGLQKTKERILEHLAVKILKTARTPHILIIDDEEIARKNLAHILEKERYSVTTAADGAEALRLLEEKEFDVVLSDLRMAGVDGMQILDKLKIRHPDTGLIMITGFATVQSAVEAMQKGAFHYIAKPFKLDEVRETVRAAVEKRFRARTTGGSVLSFSGPPGTGKTSLGRAIATALGRKFIRISLAGIKDEAEIRGHRRTYAGAMPGRIIDEIHRAQSSNPVIMLDELDKMGHDFKGDPSSALLEALDPEQNRNFVDHYLDVSFDLSNVIFILTSNVADNVPDALRDRMETIEFSGYTIEEKKEIASRFLIPRQIREKGLIESPPVFTGEAVESMIQDYTREAGIRNLARKIARICRKIARQYVQKGVPAETPTITPDVLSGYLGQRRYYFDLVEETDRVGVTTGLVRTDSGGDIIFVEAAKMRGKKELIITGSLGDVMRESAQAALSYLRSNAVRFNIPEDFFDHHDIHVHVPSGAIQKDGPSAGVTIAMALISLLTNRAAKREVAMTGEMTLTGRILRVGGIREKLLAARRAGVKTVIIPSRNREDLTDVSPDITAGIDVRTVDNISEIVDLVLC